jgi:hypothetical protein
MTTQPSRSDVHINAPLTNISIAFIQNASNFIASNVFPNISVLKQSDAFFTYDRGEFNRDEMEERAPGTESAGGTYEIGNDNYFARTRAFHKDIPDQVRANADSPISMDRDATTYVSQKALIKKEVLWNGTFFITGVWTNERDGVTGAPTGSDFQFWDEAASTPIEDVRAGRRTVLESTGFMPNVIVLGRPVYDALLDHPDIIGRLDRGQTTGPAIANRDALAALFELDEVLVMDAIQNTAKEGQADVHSFIGGKNALLAYRTPTPGILVPSAGYTFSWTGLMGSGAMGGRIKRFRREALESDRIEIQMSFDQKLIAADLGAFFLGAVAP